LFTEEHENHACILAIFPVHCQRFVSAFFGKTAPIPTLIRRLYRPGKMDRRAVAVGADLQACSRWVARSELHAKGVLLRLAMPFA
jgi:hypothetical protein